MGDKYLKGNGYVRSCFHGAMRMGVNVARGARWNIVTNQCLSVSSGEKKKRIFARAIINRNKKEKKEEQTEKEKEEQKEQGRIHGKRCA